MHNNVWPLVAVALLLASCTEEVEPADTTDTLIDFDDDDERTDTAVPLQDLTGMTGSIVVIHWPESADTDSDSYTAAAMFTDGDGGILNLTHCLLYGVPCVTSWPAAGDSEDPEPDMTFLDSASFFDAGDPITVGPDALYIDPNWGVEIYFGDPSSFGTTGGIILDGDFMPYEGSDDFTYADAMQATAPPTDERLTVGPGDSVDFEWVAGGTGDVILTIGDTVSHLEDDGAFSLEIDDLALDAPFTTAEARLARITNTEVDAAGNALQVETMSEQWFYLDYEDLAGWTELVLDSEMSETCDDAASLDPLPAGQYYGDLTDMENDHDLGYDNPTTGWATEGFEGVSAVSLLAGETLTATMRQTVFDASVYILDDSCDVDNPLAGTDDTLDGEEEVVEYTASDDETVYLVMDGWLEGGSFSVVLTIQ